MRYRQVHLDFHTSEKIGGIGEKFSKEQFQKALKLGHVDSITVFSKCHHGWAYHPSKANEMHPELKFDLLKAQIEAAHEIGVKTPVYLSAGFDEKAAVVHKDWLRYSKEQMEAGEVSFEKPYYHLMCLNTPYLEYLLEQIKEVCENYDADGIFLDIVSPGNSKCYCESCRASMADMGLDYENPADVKKHGELVYANYTKRVRETIDSVKPGLPVFHNGGHIGAGRRDLAKMNTHLELESLPTGGWGYDHFPKSAAYARTLGMEYLGMTGKFHKSWGEFGGFKHPNALRYEVALSAANGAKCSVGDQLAPNGLMDEATYHLIAAGYAPLEEREPWLKNAENVADIAIITNEAIRAYYNSEAEDPAQPTGSDNGISRILLENQYLFNIIDLDVDFTAYKLLILPDNILLDDALTEKIKAYMEQGGKVLASFKSGMKTDESGFALDIGAKYECASEYKPTYIRPSFELPALQNSAYVVYKDCLKVEAEKGESLGIIEPPYFNRTAEHFCSHLHAPACGEKYGDAIIKNGNLTYIAHQLFYEYATMGNVYVKEIVDHLIADLLGEDRSLKAALPAQGIATLMEDSEADRLIVHTLYASPVRRGKDTEIIEDIIPLYNIAVSVRADRAPKSVRLVPEGEELPFAYENGRVTFTIPKIDCWQMTEIQF
ncbi:MAG: beta-galactosidase trimerization domain-containing protein [Clostridia bacterium]|nr:beta-galactosidase trimerization domain-containing protein [Clostridia bacterium]